MSVFSDLRAELVADLAPLGVPITPAWPDLLEPPCGFITPPLSGDYVRRGPQFGGTHTVSLDLVLLVGHDEADTSLAAVEALLQAALFHLGDWDLNGVDAPAPTSVSESGAQYLASVLHLSHTVIIAEGV